MDHNYNKNINMIIKIFIFSIILKKRYFIFFVKSSITMKLQKKFTFQ
jgi:hypothetical protein